MWPQILLEGKTWGRLPSWLEGERQVLVLHETRALQQLMLKSMQQSRRYTLWFLN